MRPLAFLLFSMLFITSAWCSDLVPESPILGELPATPNPHWVWVNDMLFDYLGDGRTTLIDGDTGTYLGMLSTGVAFNSLILPTDYSALYSVETYYTRGLRGDRTDVVTIYDPQKLAYIDEIEIPPKRQAAMPSLTNYVLTDDNRFLVIYNFTPAQSVTVVDMKTRKVVGEIETAGCAQNYMTGDRRFQMLCSDGSVATVTLKADGTQAGKTLSKPFFDPDKDPVQEEGVRLGDQWMFVSYTGDIYTVDGSKPKPSFPARWSLLTDGDRAESWRPGGAQLMGIHEATKRLYVAMHQGGEFSHKDPATEIWVFDVSKKQRTQRIKLKNVVTSFIVSRDDKPLLFAVFTAVPNVDIYDALSGEHLRTVAKVGHSPMVLQTP